MDLRSFHNAAGQLLEVSHGDGLSYWSFVPNELPPAEETATIAAAAGLLGEAEYALGTLDGAGKRLPNPDLLYYTYLRREAVASSRIEGTRASFADLALYGALREAPPGSDVVDVDNYVLAFDYGLRQVRSGGITADLIRELHRKLMTGARGEKLSNPGEFRFVQNHIGGATIADAKFVPPPPEQVHPALEQLLAYLKAADDSTPVLVQAAWAHYQFETIHPFNDGNGRVGRLLIPLLVTGRRGVERSLLYLAPYFERNREEYVERLHAISTASDWSGWLQFFLRGVRDQAHEGELLSDRIMEIRHSWSDRLESASATHTAHRIADLVVRDTYVSAKEAIAALSIARQTAYNAIEVLVDCGILTEATGRSRGRVYVSHELTELLEP